MAIDKIHPVHAINRFLWSKIESEDILSKSNYSGLVPIIPVQETPEFITIIEAQPGVVSHPYLVYSWTRVSTGQAWFLKQHNIAYSIRSADDDKTSQLLNLFERELQDYDMAARRVNTFVSEFGSPAHRRFSFTHINVQVLGAPQPSGSENGVSESLVTLNVNYTEV